MMLIITIFDGTCLVPHCFSVALGKQVLLHGFAAHWHFTLSATLVDIFAYIKSHVFFGVYCADSVGNDTRMARSTVVNLPLRTSL